MPKKVAKPIKKFADEPYLRIEERDRKYVFQSESTMTEDGWLIAAYLYGKYDGRIPEKVKESFNEAMTAFSEAAKNEV